MKVLIVRSTPNYMEVQNASYNVQEVGLARALARKGVQCDIVFWTDKEEKDVEIEFDNKKFTVFYRNSKELLKNAIYTNIDELIKDYDIVQCSEHNQIESKILAKKYPEKTVVFHGPYYSEFNKRYNLMCRVFDRIVLPTYKRNDTLFMTKSDLARDFLIGKGLKAENVITAGVGIDRDAFNNYEANEIPEELQKINAFKEDYKLLYIGRLEPRRNTLFLFDVVSEMKSRGKSVKLIIIGNGNEEYVSSSFDYAEKLGVYDDIYWIPSMQQKYLKYAYDYTDIFLLPTHYEIFGMVLLEAMYFGTPVITTNNGGSQMLIDNGRDGIVIDEFDAGLWCDAIIKNKGNNEMSRLSSKKIKEHFTWDSLADTFINTYEKKLSR